MEENHQDHNGVPAEAPAGAGETHMLEMFHEFAEAMKHIVPDVKQEDCEGNTVQYMLYDGIHYPVAPGIKDVIASLKEFKVRDEDVLVLAYPKSGTHWIWEMTNMLNLHTSKPLKGIKEELFLEIIPEKFIERFSSPRVLNTHILPYLVPPGIISKRCKIIYMLRNPKDVAVSFSNHTFRIKSCYNYNGTWAAFLDLFLQGKVDYGNWFDYVLKWEQFFRDNPDVPALVLYYEDVKKDSPKVVRQIRDFLGISCTDKLCDEISDACSFQKMKDNKKHMLPKDLPEDSKKEEEVMYRKGETGDWKNWFTVAQNERFDAVFEEKMKNSKLKFQFTL